MRRVMLAAACALISATGATMMFAAGPETSAALKATDYMRTKQNADGGFPAFAADSSPGVTIDAVLGFLSAGIDPRTVTNGGNGPDDYLATQAATYSATPGGAAKLVIAAAALDIDPAAVGGVDALAAMDANYNAVTGQYGGDTMAQALYILAQEATGRPIAPEAVTFLRGLQQPAGSWEYCCGFGADTNTTAFAVRALIAAGVPASDGDVTEAFAYLATTQAASGAFPYTVPFDADPNSTAIVIQAIVAAGQSAEAGGPWDKGGGAAPLPALLAMQNAVTGAMQYFGADDAFATYQSVPGLMLSAFPELLDIPTPPPATSTHTATSTPSRSSTPERTSTRTPTRTSTPTRTATPVRTSVAAATTSTSTPIRAVAGAAATPRSGTTAGATRLPNAGTGSTHLDVIGAAMLLLGGAGLALVAGGVAKGRRARR